VAAGGLLRSFLKALGIEVFSWVTRIGGAVWEGPFDWAARDASSVFCPDQAATRAMEQEIDRVVESGDSIGGEFKAVLSGLPAGIGSCTQWDARLDTIVSAHLMSIPGIKAVQIGLGVECGTLPGSQVHDAILPGTPLRRGSNNAGGIEGGISNGEPLVVRCTMKPIPTLKEGLATIDIRDGSPARASYERSDHCAVPAASVVGEAMLIIAVSAAILSSFGLPSMDALAEAFSRQRGAL
jgi:chorismate synthase